jgi:hypothetical protein
VMPLLHVLPDLPPSPVDIVDRYDDGRVLVRFTTTDATLTVPGHLLAAATGERDFVVTPAARRLSEAQIAVLDALHRAGPWGMTDDEHEAVNGLRADSAGKRRLELQRQLLVVDTGDTRTTRRGVRARIWRITTAGEEALRSLTTATT